MKAGVKFAEGAKNFRIEEIAVPSISGREVLIKVAASGVCGVDTQIYDWATGGTFPVKLPLVLGHEVAGAIEEVGSDVTTLKPGDRVTVMSMLPCRRCHYCRQGMGNLCLNWEHVGITFNGGFAEYTKVPEDIAFKLPENVSDEAGAFVEPLAIVVNAFERLRLGLTSVVVVIGPGTLGLLSVQAARAHGASKIIVVGLDHDEMGMTKAEEAGADHTIRAGQGGASDRMV